MIVARMRRVAARASRCMGKTPHGAYAYARFTIRALKLNLDPGWKEAGPSSWTRLPYEMVSVERPSRLLRLREGLITLVVCLVTILAGLCVVMSVVTFLMRFVQQAAALLG